MDNTNQESLRRAPVRVDTYRCLRVRHRASACTACREACPRQAIALPRGPAVDAARCIGCGVCAAVCPTEALALRTTSLADLLADAGKGEVEFACRRAAGARGAQVPCLGYLDAGVLLAAVANGANVSLEVGPCADCPDRLGLQAAERAVAATNAVLAACGDERRIARRRSRAYTAQEGVSRRGLFGLLRRRVQENWDADPPTPTTPVAKGQAVRAVLTPERRALLVEAVRRLAAPRRGGLPAAEGTEALPFYDLTLAPACDNCGRCLTFCPTGALRLAREPGRAAFTFDGEKCPGCDLCVAVCPQRALTLTRASALPVPGASKPLRAGKTVRCEGCGGEFFPRAAERLCPACAKKHSLEEAIRRTLFG